MRRMSSVIALLVGGLLVGCGELPPPESAAGRSDPSPSTVAPSTAMPSTAMPSTETPSTETPSTARPSTDRTPGPPQTPATGPLPTPPTVRDVDPYLPPGLPDQIFPPGTAAYELLKRGACGPLLRQITLGEAPTTSSWEGRVPEPLTDLYTAAGEACLSNWAEARTAFERISTSALCKLDPDTGELDTNQSAFSFDTLKECQDQRRQVYQWTQGLLEAHDADASFVPNFPTAPTA